jgi:hypothetical protein
MNVKIFFALVILFIIYTVFGQGLWLSFLTEGYQSVFVANDQVYFGKLSWSGKWYKLTDIYYLQAPNGIQKTEGAKANVTDPNIQLVKLGNELHGPEDVMYLDSSKIIFWENLKSDSKVVEAINNYEQK